MTPKPLTVWAVVAPDDMDQFVVDWTTRRLRRDAIKAYCEDHYSCDWDAQKKRGFTVRKFRMVPVDAPVEGEG